MKRTISLLALLLLILILAACSKSYEGDFSHSIKDFEYTNQDGEQVALEDLEGKFWVADFIFTNCTNACPPMTANMSKVQSKIKEAGLEDEVRFVSFTIDPEYDTQEVLKEYGNRFDADYSNWDFLTGYKPEEIKEFSVKSFKSLVERTPVQDPAEGQADYNFLHSNSLYIVTPEGKAIKKYNGMQYENVEKLVEDLKNYIN